MCVIRVKLLIKYLDVGGVALGIERGLAQAVGDNHVDAWSTVRQGSKPSPAPVTAEASTPSSSPSPASAEAFPPIKDASMSLETVMD